MLLYFGVTIRDLGNVYALVGGFAATTLAYIIPGCAYLMTNKKSMKSIHHSESESLVSSTGPQETLSSRVFALAAGLLIGWGVLVMILCCTSIVVL